MTSINPKILQNPSPSNDFFELDSNIFLNRIFNAFFVEGAQAPLRVYWARKKKSPFGVCATAHSQTSAAYAPPHIAAQRMRIEAAHLCREIAARQIRRYPPKAGFKRHPATPRLTHCQPQTPTNTHKNRDLITQNATFAMICKINLTF